jgi:hypothetical protein
MATFETALRAKESTLFTNLEETAFLISSVNQPGLGNDCTGCIVPENDTV